MKPGDLVTIQLSREVSTVFRDRWNGRVGFILEATRGHLPVVSVFVPDIGEVTLQVSSVRALQ